MTEHHQRKTPEKWAFSAFQPSKLTVGCAGVD
jgi:hypothetical protein